MGSKVVDGAVASQFLGVDGVGGRSLPSSLPAISTLDGCV